MDACGAVEREVDRVLLKFGGISEHADRVLKDIIRDVESLKSELENAPKNHELTPTQIAVLRDVTTKVKETVQRLATDHRDLHSTVSKVGKAIDRNFVADFSATCRDDVFAGSDKVQLLNEVICQHFYRQGLQDVADELAQEAGIKADATCKESFVELNLILDSLKRKDLEPALKWAAEHRSSLEAQNSTLEFKLHRLRFIDLIQEGPAQQEHAINYARNYFKQFVDRHEKEIQSLMGMFLYLPKGMSGSPYSYLLDPEMWVEIYEVFTRDACLLLGLSVDSPLAVCINAGCRALPALLNIKQVMLQRQVSTILGNASKDELPIEIDLGSDSRYHSIFACPILKQQSTQSNPPMRLTCGHCISRDALTKLTTNGNKLKCPYCPMESTPSDARLIYF